MKTNTNSTYLNLILSDTHHVELLPVITTWRPFDGREEPTTEFALKYSHNQDFESVLAGKLSLQRLFFDIVGLICCELVGNRCKLGINSRFTGTDCHLSVSDGILLYRFRHIAIMKR